MLYRVLVPPLLLALCSTATAFDFDGKYDSSQYDHTFAVDYFVDCGDTGSGCSKDGVTITGQHEVKGGTLAFKTVENNGNFVQYLFYAHPLGFKDNSYYNPGDKKNKPKKWSNSELAEAADYLVGWQTGPDPDENGGFAGQGWGYVGSEFFEFELDSTEGKDSVKVDYEGKAAGEGVENEIVDTTITAMSTAGYNQQFGAYADKDDKKDIVATKTFGNHSPITLRPDEIAGCEDEGDSSEACYALADLDENKVDGNPNGNFIDWQFMAGVELKLETDDGSKFFDINDNNFTLDDAQQLVTLVATHASPSKFTSDKKEPDTRTICDPKTDSDCGTSGGGGGGNAVSEPGTMLLLGGALGLLGFRARRQKRIAA